MALFMLCHEETINRISNWSIVSEVPSQSHHVFLRCPLWYTVAVNQHWHYTYPILIPWQPVFVVQDLPENCQSNFHREAWRSTRMARRSTVLIRRWSVRSYQPYHFLLNVSSARNPAEPRLRSLHTNQCVCTVSFEELNKTTQETFIFIPFHALTSLNDRKGIRPVKKLKDVLLVVTIWLELCTSYGSSCQHHLYHT